MLFLEGESVIYHQRSFFKENSVVAVARTDLCLFWKVGSVIYYQRSFFKENSVMAVARAMLFLEGGECYISSGVIFQGGFSGGCCRG
jgi:hypothetical protein